MASSEQEPADNRAAAVADDNLSDTSRLETFSDGVFAIAITLLIIEIRPPHLESGEGSPELLQALLALWPNYLGYIISFLTIGIMWINHHTVFRLFARTDPALTALNLLFLLCIAFVPFPTALMAEYLGHDGQLTATLVFGGWFTITAGVYNILWRYATGNRRLIDPDVSQARIDAIHRRFRLGVPIYIVATLLAFISPPLSVLVQMALAIFYLLPYGGVWSRV